MLDNKAQMRTVEAFLSILLMFSALAMTTFVSPKSNIDSDGALMATGMQALVSMDEDGELGRLIDEGNWTALANALSLLLPLGVSFNLTVYDENLQKLNNISVTNGILSNRNIHSFQYPCVSPNVECNYYLLQLQLSKAR